MTWLKAMLRRWAGAPEVDVTQTDLNNAYQLGFQNGAAAGECRGRQNVIRELEIVLESRGRVLADLEPEEVALAKTRTRH